MLKKDENVTIFQQSRMDELMKLRVERAKSQGLSEELIEKIFTHIHSDSVNIQARSLTKKQVKVFIKVPCFASERKLYDLKDDFKRVSDISESASVKSAGEIAVLRSKGERIIGLHIGEPDFLPEPQIANAITDAMNKGKVRYSKRPEKLRFEKQSFNQNQRTLPFHYQSIILLFPMDLSSLYLIFFKRFATLEMRLLFPPLIGLVFLNQ